MKLWNSTCVCRSSSCITRLTCQNKVDIGKHTYALLKVLPSYGNAVISIETFSDFQYNISNLFFMLWKRKSFDEHQRNAFWSFKDSKLEVQAPDWKMWIELVRLMTHYFNWFSLMREFSIFLKREMKKVWISCNKFDPSPKIANLSNQKKVFLNVKWKFC